MYLLDMGADANGAYKNISFLTEACYSDYLEVAELLVKHSANVNRLHDDYDTALLWACPKFYLNMEQILLFKILVAIPQ